MYANEHGGHFPDRLEDVALTQDVTAEVFICPSSQGERAPGKTPEEFARHLSHPEHLSYVYLGKGLGSRTAHGRTVVMYEPLVNHNRDGTNVLFADGTVEFVQRDEAKRIVPDLAADQDQPRADQARR